MNCVCMIINDFCSYQTKEKKKKKLYRFTTSTKHGRVAGFWAYPSYYSITGQFYNV